MPITPQVKAGLDARNAATMGVAPLLRGEPGSRPADRAQYLGALTAHLTPPGLTIEEIDMGGIRYRAADRHRHQRDCA